MSLIRDLHPAREVEETKKIWRAGTPDASPSSNRRSTFKDPDTMADAVDDEVKRFVAKNTDGMAEPLTLEAFHVEIAARTVEAKRLIERKWMEYGEYLTVEFDTTAGTATVIHR